MKELIDKAYSAMNLLLIGAGLLAWACLASGPDPITLGVKISKKIEALPAAERGLSEQKFLDELTLLPPHEASVQRRMPKMRIGLVSDLRKRAQLTADTPEFTQDQVMAFQRTAERLAKLKDNAELLREGKAIDLIGTPADKNSLLGLLAQFNALVQKATLPSTATLEELKSKLDSRVKIPFVDRDVDSQTAVIVLSMSMVALLFFLISMMAGVKFALDKNSEFSGIEWVFFLPGRIGVGLGILWLLSPALVLAVSAVSTSTDALLRLGVLGVLLGVGGKAIFDSLRLRKIFYLRFHRMKKADNLT